jgi:hypothetical protein
VDRFIKFLNLVFFLAAIAGATYMAYLMRSMHERIDRANVEYQFVVTDHTITVYDRNRIVGTVALEGQLDSLIKADNQ